MQMITTTELKKWSGIEMDLFRNKRLPLLYQGHDPELVLAFRFQFDWLGGVIYSEFIELLIPKVACCQPFRSMLCIALMETLSYT